MLEKQLCRHGRATERRDKSLKSIENSDAFSSRLFLFNCSRASQTKSSLIGELSFRDKLPAMPEIVLFPSQNCQIIAEALLNRTFGFPSNHISKSRCRVPARQSPIFDAQA